MTIAIEGRVPPGHSVVGGPATMSIWSPGFHSTIDIDSDASQQAALVIMLMAVCSANYVLKGGGTVVEFDHRN